MGLGRRRLLAVPLLLRPGRRLPPRALRIVLPFAPGGAADAVARLLARELGARLDRPVVVDNRGGGSGIIAAQAVRAAPADGETLLYATSIYAVSPHLLDLPFDPLGDFVPLGGIAHLPTLLFAGPRGAPYADAPAVLSALGRGWPVSFASGGAGTPSHMAALLLAGAAGGRPELVLYRGGGPAMDGLLMHQAEMMFDNPHPGLFEGVATGALRLLMAMQPDPIPGLPAVPTLGVLRGAVAETVRCWHGLLAPRGTPAAMLTMLAEALGAAAAAADVQAALRALAIEPAPAGPAEFAAFFRAETARWGRFLAEAPIAG